MTLSQIIGTIPQWLTAGGVISALGLFIKWHLGHQKLHIDAQQVNLQGNEIRERAEQHLRDHYASEVSGLRDKLDKQNHQFRQDLTDLEQRYRKLLDEADERHEKCRVQVGLLEDKVHGLIKMIAQASVNKVLHLSEESVPPDIREMADRVSGIHRERDP